jgi:hypothetical protein
MFVDTKFVEETANAVLHHFGWNLTAESAEAELSLDKLYIGRMYSSERYIVWSRKVGYAFFRQQANLFADRLTEWGKRVNEVPDTRIVDDAERFDPGPQPSHDLVFESRTTDWRSQEALRGLGEVRYVQTTPNRLTEEGTCTFFLGQLYVRMDDKVHCFGKVRSGNGQFPFYGFQVTSSARDGEQSDRLGTVIRYDDREIVGVVTGESLSFCDRFQIVLDMVSRMWEPGLGVPEVTGDRVHRLYAYMALHDVPKTFQEVADEDVARLGDADGNTLTDRRIEAVYLAKGENLADWYNAFINFTA